MVRYRGYLFFSVKDRNIFHQEDTIGNIFMSGAAMSENITDGVHELNKFLSLAEKNKYSVYFMLFTLSGRSFIKIPSHVPLLHSNALQNYIKCEKCKVNDIIFPSGCEASAINVDNKNMKIDIFSGATCVRSKNIFTAISRYPTEKHEII